MSRYSPKFILASLASIERQLRYRMEGRFSKADPLGQGERVGTGELELNRRGAERAGFVRPKAPRTETARRNFWAWMACTAVVALLGIQQSHTSPGAGDRVAQDSSLVVSSFTVTQIDDGVRCAYYHDTGTALCRSEKGWSIAQDVYISTSTTEQGLVVTNSNRDARAVVYYRQED